MCRSRRIVHNLFPRTQQLSDQSLFQAMHSSHFHHRSGEDQSIHGPTEGGTPDHRDEPPSSTVAKQGHHCSGKSICKGNEAHECFLLRQPAEMSIFTGK